MNSDSIRKKVKEDYNKIAEDFSSTRRFPWKDFERFNKYINPQMRCLDLGCGNGRLLKYLSRQGFRYYLGIDQSGALIKKAKEQFPSFDFKEADIARLMPAKKAEYDILFAIASFHHLPKEDQLNALISWKTYLKPSGHLIMLNWNLFQKKYRSAVIKSIFGPYGFYGCEIAWKNELKRYYYAFSKKALSDLLQKAGFEIIENEYISDGRATNFSSAKNIFTVAKI